MHPLLQETNRLRLLRRFIAGYVLLVAGLFGLMDLFAREVLGLGAAEPFSPRHLALYACLTIAGVCNLLTTKVPGE